MNNVVTRLAQKAKIYFATALIAASPFGMMIARPQVTSAARAPQFGLNLDIARRYWTVNGIKSMIRELDAAGGTYLHLHASDDQSYGIESQLLGQTASTADVHGSKYTNPDTGKAFLTSQQLRAIESYAKHRGIETILEVDTPGHMRAIRELMETHPIEEYPVDQVFSEYGPHELDVHSQTAWSFSEALYSEISSILRYDKRMHIGGDEFAGGRSEHIAWANYANHLDAMLGAQGIDTIVWNDAITSSTINLLSKDITVAYWNYDVWGSSRDRARQPDITAAGFNVLNYNGYYNYWIPYKNEPRSDRRYMVHDIQANWNRGVYGYRRSMNANDPRIIGAAYSIWGEDSADMKDSTLIKRGVPMLNAAARKTLR